MNIKKLVIVVAVATALIVATTMLVFWRENSSRSPDLGVEESKKSSPITLQFRNELQPPDSHSPKLLDFDPFKGDPMLVEEFLEGEGRSATNLIAAFSLLEGEQAREYLEEANKKYPGHPLVVGYAMFVDDMEIDVELSSRLMIEGRPNDASGYLLGAIAGIQRGDDIASIFEKYIGPVSRAGLVSEVFLDEVSKARFNYARKYELMPEVPAAEVAVKSGGFRSFSINDTLRRIAYEHGEAAIAANLPLASQKWFLMALVAIQAAQNNFFISGDQLVGLYEKAIVEKLSDDSVESYLNTTREQVVGEITQDIATFRQYQHELNSLASNLTGSHYREYLRILVNGGEYPALEFVRSIQ